jgi:hypothetical protein
MSMNLESALKLFFDNFGFIAVIVGVVVAIVRAARGRPFFEELLRWSVFFGVGLNSTYSAIGHLFLPEYSAKLIGWEDSPFQLEVGSADLAIGIVGLLALWGNYGFRLAIAIVAAIFCAIDAVGHVRQMVLENNFATGNAGSWFWVDVSLPVILMVSAAVCGLRHKGAEEQRAHSTDT